MSKKLWVPTRKHQKDIDGEDEYVVEQRFSARVKLPLTKRQRGEDEDE